MTSETPKNESSTIRAIFNHPDNYNGKYIRVLMISPIAQEGINLMDVVNVIIPSPHWNIPSMYQTTSRAIRIGGHRNFKKRMRIPDDEKVQVNVYRMAGIFKVGSVPIDKQSTDLIIYNLEEKKSFPIRRVLKAAVESSADFLNHYLRNTEKTIASSYSAGCLCEIKEWPAQVEKNLVPETSTKEALYIPKSPEMKSYHTLYAGKDGRAIVPFLLRAYQQRKIRGETGIAPISLEEISEEMRKIGWNMDPISFDLAVQEIMKIDWQPLLRDPNLKLCEKGRYVFFAPKTEENLGLGSLEYLDRPRGIHTLATTPVMIMIETVLNLVVNLLKYPIQDPSYEKWMLELYDDYPSVFVTVVEIIIYHYVVNHRKTSEINVTTCPRYEETTAVPAFFFRQPITNINDLIPFFHPSENTTVYFESFINQFLDYFRTDAENAKTRYNYLQDFFKGNIFCSYQIMRQIRQKREGETRGRRRMPERQHAIESPDEVYCLKNRIVDFHAFPEIKVSGYARGTNVRQPPLHHRIRILSNGIWNYADSEENPAYIYIIGQERKRFFESGIYGFYNNEGVFSILDADRGKLADRRSQSRGRVCKTFHKAIIAAYLFLIGDRTPFEYAERVSAALSQEMIEKLEKEKIAIERIAPNEAERNALFSLYSYRSQNSTHDLCQLLEERLKSLGRITGIKRQ